MMRPWLIFAAGLVVGVVGVRFVLGRPEGRRVAKRAITLGLAAGDWVATQLETLREDLSDLVAEAKAERARDMPAT